MLKPVSGTILAVGLMFGGIAGSAFASASPMHSGEIGSVQVRAEAAVAVGQNPFTPSVAGAAMTVPSTRSGGTVSGSTPGLYGGTRDNTCDSAALVGFLEADPDRAAAFAGVEGIEATGIGDYVAGLTPVTLRNDTAVTNHGFTDGAATAFPAVLQAGTAVLVDRFGVPQVRCSCGNPLDGAAHAPGPVTYTGDAWAGLSSDGVDTITPSAAALDDLVLETPSGGQLTRPVASRGDQDTDGDEGDGSGASGGGAPGDGTSGGGTGGSDGGTTTPGGGGSDGGTTTPGGDGSGGGTTTPGDGGGGTTTPGGGGGGTTTPGDDDGGGGTDPGDDDGGTDPGDDDGGGGTDPGDDDGGTDPGDDDDAYVACVVSEGVTQDRLTVTGTPGNDTIDCTAANPGKTITGGDGNDTITGSSFDDDIDGGDGNNTITGGPGNDDLRAGDGDDTITGSAGEDTIDGGAGENTIVLSEQSPARTSSQRGALLPDPDVTAVDDTTTTGESTPADDSAAAEESTPVEGSTPVEESTPAEEPTPAEDSAVAEESTPVEESTPPEESGDEDSSSDDRDLIEVTVEEVPVLGDVA